MSPHLATPTPPTAFPPPDLQFPCSLPKTSAPQVAAGVGFSQPMDSGHGNLGHWPQVCVWGGFWPLPPPTLWSPRFLFLKTITSLAQRGWLSFQSPPAPPLVPKAPTIFQWKHCWVEMVRPRPAPGHSPQVSRDAQAPTPPRVLAPLPSSKHLLAGTPPAPEEHTPGTKEPGPDGHAGLREGPVLAPDDKSKGSARRRPGPKGFPCSPQAPSPMGREASPSPPPLLCAHPCACCNVIPFLLSLFDG